MLKFISESAAYDQLNYGGCGKFDIFYYQNHYLSEKLPTN